MASWDINKGIGRTVEFKGLKAQYLFLFARRLAGDLHRGGRALPPWRQSAALPRHMRIGCLTSGVANLRYEP